MRNLIKLLAVLGLALSVAACTKQVNDSTEAEIRNAFYSAPGGPSLTIFTTVNSRSGAGAHTGMMINANQRVIWDPAGGYLHEDIAEKGDVLYGVTPRILDGYRRFHSSDVFYLVEQEIPVSAAVAAQAMQLAQSYGNVPDAQCSLSTSRILKQIPGFEGIKEGWYPVKLMEQVAQFQSVKTRAFKTGEDLQVRPYAIPAQ